MRHLISCAVVLAAAAACNGTDPSDDPSRCQQTFEFGNTGCADLIGLVTDGGGHPIAGASVDVPGHAESGRDILIVTGFRPADVEGRYSLRAIRETGETPTEGPDTVTVWVRASEVPSSQQPAPRDSVLVLLQLRPVGEQAVVTEVPTLVVSD